MRSANFLTHWYLYLPSVLLAAFIVLLAVRLVLTAVLSADNPAMRVLVAVTKPVVVLAMVWLAALRVAVFWVAVVKGVRL
jgi:hypothetical protein